VSIHVLKLGGGAGIQHAPALANLARRVAGGEAWVLVHGCSDAANRLAEEQGYPAQTLVSPNGHTSRYTDPRTLAIFCQAAASVNFALVGELVSLGAPAVGLIPNERGGAWCGQSAKALSALSKMGGKSSSAMTIAAK
jgi:acetylglutamate/LysW-gamma-L-alpha-aminoadipate kinase